MGPEVWACPRLPRRWCSTCRGGDEPLALLPLSQAADSPLTLLSVCWYCWSVFRNWERSKKGGGVAEGQG